MYDKPNYEKECPYFNNYKCENGNQMPCNTVIEMCSTYVDYLNFHINSQEEIANIYQETGNIRGILRIDCPNFSGRICMLGGTPYPCETKNRHCHIYSDWLYEDLSRIETKKIQILWE